jgi:N-acetylmuramic acid 6-phosphate (MurNAc-6-P) etherase
VSLEQATQILQESDGEVKTAIVALLANVSPEVARQRLRATGGFVRKAIG